MSTNLLADLTDVRTPLFLAPQAGVSESPFRRLCREFGADVVETEFVSADGILHGNERTLHYLRFDPEEHPIGVQIFGSDPGSMGEAAAWVAETFAPDFVDINFGCPVKKVVKRNGGSGCLRDMDLVEAIIRACVDQCPLPITTKIRSGFDEKTRDPVGIALRCQDAGSRMLTLHARTRADMYRGTARWEEIRAVKEALEIPVIGNGDVKSGHDALRMYEETGCDGIMIARGSHGDPWIFRQARAALNGEPVPEEPTVEERFHITLQHARNAIDFEPNTKKAVLEFRKHLGWYTKGLPHGKQLRIELFQVETLGEMESAIQRYLDAWRAGELRDEFAEAVQTPN